VKENHRERLLIKSYTKRLFLKKSYKIRHQLKRIHLNFLKKTIKSGVTGPSKSGLALGL
jgi:hypothetical protein